MRLRVHVFLTALGLLHLGSAATIQRKGSKSGLFRRDLSTSPNTCQLESPAPSGAICGDRGYLSEPFVLLAGNQTTPDLQTCQTYCLERNSLPADPTYTHCEAFAFDTSSNNCVLYLSTLESQGFYDDSTSSLEFYSQTCFQCQLNCPDSPGDSNLVENPGFEISNEIGPFSQYDGANPAVITSPGHNSQNALLSANGCTGVLYYRDLCQGQHYSFSIDILHVGTQDNSDKLMSFGNLFFTYNYPNISTTDWQTIYNTFEASAYSPEQFSIQMPGYGGSSFYLDNVEIFPVSGVPATTGSSIVTNGGFESGNLAPWTAVTADGENPVYNVSSPGLTEGNYALYFSAYLDTYNEYSDSDFVVSQPIDMVFGQRYLVSFDYKTSAYQILTVDICGSQWSVGAPTNEITTFAEVFTATTNTDTLTIAFLAQINNVQDVVLDNISVTALA